MPTAAARLQRWPLARQLILGLGGLGFLAALVVGWLAYSDALRREEDVIRTRGREVSVLLAKVMVDPVIMGDRNLTLTMLTQAQAEMPELVQAEVTRRDGDVLTRIGSQDTAPTAEVAHEEPIVVAGERFGTLTTTWDTAAMLRRARSSALRIALLSALPLALFACLSLLFVRTFVSTPVRRIDDGLRAIAGGAEHVDVPAQTSREFTRLAASVSALSDALAERDAREAALIETRDALSDENERRRETERSLRTLAARLQTSNRELERFAYVSSHDLQEPLRKIRAFSDLLVKRYGDTFEGEAADYLNRMQSAAERMQRLIDDLLELSRLQRFQGRAAAVRLDDVVRAALDTLDGPIRDTGATIRIDDVLPTIQGYPVQLERLFQNLIGNSIKFRKPDEPPNIALRATRSEERRGFSSGWEVAVTDEGIGFDESYKEKIFTIFQRLHGRREYEGTGIGLAICRRIVDLHGGTIEARSVEGQGATFTVFFPDALPDLGSEALEA